MSVQSKPKVVVVGAGVSGLTSALLLLKAGFDVSVIGRNIPGDFGDAFYASPFAGAQWFSFAKLHELRLQEFDRISYREFLRLAREEPRSGVLELPIKEYTTKDQEHEFELPWFQYFVEDFKVLDKSNHTFPSDDLVKGFTFKTVTITTVHYLSYLHQKVIELGGSVKRAYIDHIKDAYEHHSSGEKPEIIVNCTGLLAKDLKGVEDKTMFAEKGQIVVLRNSILEQRVVAHPPGAPETEAFYLFPRKEGGCIVGGLHEETDNFDTTVDKKLSQRILERARKYAPELFNPTVSKSNKPYFDVVTEYVAFRPARRENIRLERRGNIIHNYGAGSAGYQSSYGTASGVVKLAKEFVRSKL